MEIRNFTPHVVNLLVNGELVEIPVYGPAPRVSSHELPIEGDFPFESVKVVYGDINGLPPEEEGVVLIVSKMCCDAAPERRDLWYPTRLIRDEEGRIIGCGALAH